MPLRRELPVPLPPSIRGRRILLVGKLLSVSRSAARSSCRRIWRAIGPAVRAVDAQRDVTQPALGVRGIARPYTASELRYSGAARGVPILGYPLVEVRCSGMRLWGFGFARPGVGFGMRPGLRIRPRRSGIPYAPGAPDSVSPSRSSPTLAEFRYPPVVVLNLIPPLCRTRATRECDLRHVPGRPVSVV